jgi:hypothetical protein
MQKSLPSLLLDELYPSLKDRHFSMSRGKKWYVRKNDGREERYQLVVLDGKPGYRVKPSLSVRFDEAERLFHKTSGFEPKYQGGTPTVGIDLIHDLRFVTPGDIHSVAARLMSIFEEEALPYFDQFPNMAAVDSAINDKPTEPCIHRVLPWFRCSTGIIAAKLTHRTNLDELIGIYRRVLTSDNNGYYLPMFNALVADLASQQN